MIRRTLLAAAAALGLTAAPAMAQDRITLVLNWLPGADHAPLYWAQQQNLYRDANIALTIENGRGSGFAAQRVGSGQAQVGIVDAPAALQARAQGADLVAGMMIYVQSPYGIYWKRSSGISGPQDFRGRRFGAPPADAARVMWPMIARAVGIQPNEVTWVNIAPEAKVASLQSGAIQATTHFYNVHYIYERTFGDDLGFVLTRDIGFNPYGNAFWFNGAWLRANEDAARRFTRVTQRAYRDCLANPAPCVAAVAGPAATSVEDLAISWRLVGELMADDPAGGRPLGGMDPARMATTIEAVRTAFNAPAMEPAQVMRNDLLDAAIPSHRAPAR
jgi:NitT/TauT family transport system substrate-binding protein